MFSGYVYFGVLMAAVTFGIVIKGGSNNGK